jgi:Spx/MgsR family transcriptional regulator
VTVSVYGVANCTTVKRARAWLDEHGVVYAWHDFKKGGVPEARLDQWIAQLGWEALLNRQGTTWRQLDDAARARVKSAAAARALMLERPSVIKRPVVEWSARATTVGFAEDRFRAQLRA